MPSLSDWSSASSYSISLMPFCFIIRINSITNTYKSSQLLLSELRLAAIVQVSVVDLVEGRRDHELLDENPTYEKVVVEDGSALVIEPNPSLIS